MIEVVGGDDRSRMGIKYVDKQAEIKEFFQVNELSRDKPIQGSLGKQDNGLCVFARVLDESRHKVKQK